MNKTKTKSFDVGDEVFVSVDPRKTWMSHFQTGFKGIVLERDYCQGRWSYGVKHPKTGGTWWYDHEDFTLVSPRTEKSELQAYRYLSRMR